MYGYQKMANQEGTPLWKALLFERRLPWRCILKIIQIKKYFYTLRAKLRKMNILKIDSSYNTITGNNIVDNKHGIVLYLYSNSNTIFGNTISNNNHGGYGIWAKVHSNGNLIYHNNFIDNTQNAYDESTNQWDNGLEGNYWDDWNGTGTYSIPPSGNNEDRYPLMNEV